MEHKHLDLGLFYFNMNNIKEIWKDVVNYENLYKISNLGRVKSLYRMGANERICKLHIGTRGYLEVNISKNNIRKKVRVHRLIAEAFIPNPENKPEVNHIDGNKLNNSIENLEWVTRSENIQHSFKIGLNYGRKGAKHKRSRKIINTTTNIIYDSIVDAANKNNIKMNTLWDYLNKRYPNKTNLKYYE